MQARVWNDNDYPFTDSFKGETVTIPPKKYVEMEFYEAHEFKGKYSPIRIGADEQPMKESLKMIRVEKIADSAQDALDAASVTCQACGKKYESNGVLQAHIDEQHLEQLADPEVAEKRGRGRPKKEA